VKVLFLGHVLGKQSSVLVSTATLVLNRFILWGRRVREMPSMGVSFTRHGTAGAAASATSSG
jgi:hypothetical protein